MIDEYWTWKFYGYRSDELSYGSGRLIVARCDGCCQYRVLRNCDYRDLCLTCMNKSNQFCNILKGIKKPPRTKEHCDNISKANKCRTITDEWRRNISVSMQGIPYEEWTGFVANGEYCEKFDETCRERIRAKYGCRCYICDKLQDENMTKTGRSIKLAVHHVDRNKMQGCNGVQWKLIPLCMTCHNKTHSNTWIARIEYLLNVEDM